MKILINADRRLGNNCLAFQELDGVTIIERLVDISRKAGSGEVYIYSGRKEDIARIEDICKPAKINFVSSRDEIKDCITIETGTVYNPQKLARLLKAGKNPSGAVLWEIRAEKDLDYAQSLLNKRHLYPIAKYYIVPIAQFLARLFKRTAISANSLTIFDAALGFVICTAFIFYNAPTIRIMSILILAWWMLDHADGYLARLRYEQSALGAFLDSFLGSLLWHLMHLSLSIGLYLKTRQEIYLILGLLYLFGSFMFILSNSLLSEIKTKSQKEKAQNKKVFMAPSGIKRIISLMDDTDVRIHILAISCALCMPVISLIYNLLWSNFRWLLNLAYASIKLQEDAV